MTELRAFVGHSFADDDKAVVEPFLKFFGTLQDGIMPFSWEHALAAESRDLTAKVLEKINGKNVFIGIYTRKERVVKREPQRHFLGFALGRYEFEWKTSDWIIQEIGLSIGRRMHLVLLIENGVRIPGALQGNINFISFNRDRPHQCFTQILEMLKSIVPNDTIQETPNAEKARTEAGVIEGAQHNDPEWTIPKPGWSQQDFEMAIFRAILLGDDDKKALLQKLFEDSGHAKDEKTVASWKAAVEYYTILYGSGGRLETLKTLATKNQKNSKVLSYLGRAYTHFDSHLEAARIHESAAEKAKLAQESVDNLTHAALAYLRADRHAMVEGVANRIRNISADANDEMLALLALKSIYEEMNRSAMVIALNERITELTPDDATGRFNLAYSHSTDGDRDLALYHYERIPERDRTGVTLNNLGVAYSHLRIKGRAVSAFKRARGLGETLAMSNLAYRYSSAGFLEEAKLECETAVRSGDYHNNVNLAMARIFEITNEEEKKVQEIISRAGPKCEYLRQFGRAITCSLPKDVPLRWKHPKYGTLDFTTADGSLTAFGSYKKKGEHTNALMGISSPILTGDRTVIVTLSGTLLGRAAQCTFTRDDGIPKSVGLFSALDSTETVLMYFDWETRVWKLLERPFSDDARFTTLIPVDTE